MEMKSCLKDRLREALQLREKKAIDIVNDLDIPRSAISQYMSGKTQNMDHRRLYAISQYLNINEAWLLGYDVPMERPTAQKNDIISDVVIRMRRDSDFFSVVETLNSLDKEKVIGVKQLLSAFL